MGEVSLSRARSIVETSGFGGLLSKVPPFIVQRLHPSLPRSGWVELNGVVSPIPKRRLVPVLPDYLTKWVPTDDSEYEAQFISGIRRSVVRGDSVRLVGGGNGISTVAAARASGPEGDVTVYEAGAKSVGRTRHAARLNDVDDRVTVKHAVVGDQYATRGDSGDAASVPPSGLGECDVLAIDADGAELGILRSLEATPARLVVEHHAVLDEGRVVVDYQLGDVEALVRDLGYRIVRLMADDTAAYGTHEECVIVAVSGGRDA